MRVLLGSGGYRTPERVAFLVERMRAFFGPVDHLLFVPYALHDHDGYLEALRQRGLDAGYRLEGIHRCADPVAAVEAAQAIFVGGGNTFRLLAEWSGRWQGGKAGAGWDSWAGAWEEHWAVWWAGSWPWPPAKSTRGPTGRSTAACGELPVRRSAGR